MAPETAAYLRDDDAVGTSRYAHDAGNRDCEAVAALLTGMKDWHHPLQDPSGSSLGPAPGT